MRRSSARRHLMPVAALLLVVGVAAPVPAGAEPPPPTADQAAVSADEPLELTLITGDKVTVAKGSGRAVSVQDVQRAPGTTGAVKVTVEAGDTFVLPDEAMAYVASGLLDKQLFNISELVAQGYDNARMKDLPLIVTSAPGGSTLAPDAAGRSRSAGPALPGVRVGRELRSVGGAAVRAERSQAASLWSTLTSASAARRAQPGTSTTPAFAAGIDRIWLDGKAKALLADTTAQIGAPEVWKTGATGAGVRVAVLDSGVDATHPDLAQRVVASRSFVAGEEVVDRNGHGTHTASTVAGTGAASDGKERGVAPGADLVVGKVLGDNGSGPISGIIAGMEWAVRTERAKVINMSLGTAAYHTQDDPLSQAVNRLSAETGALFVIAAGNSGNTPYTVSAPGTADAALTVGAVDTSDQLAGFSSIGPRMLDDGLKPDLTAPGVDVLAARSQQMNDGSEGYYRSDSGTSMAAPHVAGAAALLAGEHPDWTGQQIKDALMSTTALTPAYTPYEGGTGRLDVAAAYLRGQIVATGSVDAGLVAWSPRPDRTPIKRQITYRNTTDRAITLQLSTERGATPAGVFTLAANQVTVPARGTSTVGLVANPKDLTPGQYAAQVVAKSTTSTVHTAVGLSVEAEKRSLTVQLKDKAGKPVSGEVEITGADGKTNILWAPDGKITSRWAPGSYTVGATLDVQGSNGPHSLGLAFLMAPEVDLTTDRTVVLDGSRLREVKVATPQPTSVTTSRIDLFRSFGSATPDPNDRQALHQIYLPPPAYDSVWALPTKTKVQKGSFFFTTRFRAEQTPLKITYGGRSLDDTLLVQPGSPAFQAGKSRVNAVFAGTGSSAGYNGLSARGKAVVVRSSTEVTPFEQATAAHTAGAAMLLVVNDTDGRKSDWYGDPDGRTAGPIRTASLTVDEGEALISKIKAGRTDLTVEAHPVPSYLYDLADYHQGLVPDDPSAATDPGSLARIENDFAPPLGQQVLESREDSPAYEHWPAAYPYAGFGMVRAPKFPRKVAAGHRTDWVSAGAKWQQYASIDGWSTFTDVVSYQPRSVQNERWFGPVVRPRMVNFEVPHRVGNAMGGMIAGFGDGGSAHSGDSMMTRSFKLYQGDELLMQNGPRPDFGVGGLAPEKRPYRLVVDTVGKPELTPYSTATHTEWSFTSSEAENQPLPLVQLDYTTEVDAAGRAKRSSVFSVKPVVLGSDAREDTVTGVAVEVSYDDGATWQRQEVKQNKGLWQTRLQAPARAGHVSVRVTATQRNGGGVSQTITRAFGLK
ncbi:S8 family serine peptidase [Kribbella sp. CA-253562]|uniref:S8 family serine peptidase n=1 Tax=Kribbella sp. CA-253562 TaxID=3239942 RepID=UPI003D8E4BEB